MYRRVCLLRSEGRSGEAQRMEETELAAAAMQAREASESGPEADARLEALVAGESERVAAAFAFAEVLAPMLSDRLRALSPARAVAGNSGPSRPDIRPARDARGIADYIEEMLAQDRAASR